MKKFLHTAIWLTLAGVLVAACQDTETPSKAKSDSDCLTVKSANNGAIVEGQYIVVFNNSGLPATGRSENAAARILSHYRLPADRILSNFRG